MPAFPPLSFRHPRLNRSLPDLLNLVRIALREVLFDLEQRISPEDVLIAERVMCLCDPGTKIVWAMVLRHISEESKRTGHDGQVGWQVKLVLFTFEFSDTCLRDAMATLCVVE